MHLGKLRPLFPAFLLILLLAPGCGGDDDSDPASGGSGGQSGTGGTGATGGSGGGTGGTETGGTGGGTGGTTGGSGGGETGGTGGQTGGSGGASGAAGEAGNAGQAGTGGAGGCTRSPGPDDFDRKIVVAHDKGPGGVDANVYEVLDLSVSGQITRPNVTFEMGSGEGEIVFTPDGQVGLVLQGQADYRSIGVFRFDENGDPVVIHAAFEPTFYPHKIIMHPSGAFAYVLDGQWVNNGGGIYRLDIGCDGTVTEGGKLIEAKLPYELILLGGDRAFLTSSEFLGSSASEEAHLIDLTSPPVRVASSDAFGDDESIVVSTAVTADGKYALLGDDSMFGGARVGVVQIDGNSLAFEQVVTSVPAPVAIVPSPNNDVVLVVSEYPDDLHVLDYDPTAASNPFSLRGKLAYVGEKPALPGTAVMIERGSLAGHVLVAELYGVRQVRFTDGGEGVEDAGLFETGQSFPDTVGAVGVQK